MRYREGEKLQSQIAAQKPTGLIDYSQEGLSERIAGEIAWVRSLTLDIESVEAMVLEDVFLERMARLKVLEANASVGLAAATAEIPYDGFWSEDALALEELKSLSDSRAKEALASLRESVSKGFAGADPSAEAKLAAANALCLAYGFGTEKNLERAMADADSFAAFSELADAEGKLLKGIKYYIECRLAAECGAKAPSPGGYGCGRSSPWRMLANWERDWTGGRKFSILGSRWKAGQALVCKEWEFLDNHTQNRLKFAYAAESFKYDKQWRKEIEIGLLTGVKEDADVAAWAIMEAGRSLGFRSEYKVASLVGYKGVSALVAQLDMKDGPIAGAKFDRFVASGTDIECAYLYAEYIFNEGKPEPAFAWMRKCASDGHKPAQLFLAHMLKNVGSLDESLFWLKKHADTDEQSKLELFFEIRDDPNQADEAERLAEELCHTHGKVAYWLGQRHFAKKRHKEALETLEIGHSLEDATCRALLAFMNLHGYATKENLERGLALMRDAEKSDPDATLPRMLLEASGIGGTAPLENLKSQFKSWMTTMEETNPDQAHFASALFNLGIMARQPQNARFWKLIKERAELGQGFRSLNQAGANLCFFSLVELCGASVAAQWSRKGAYLVQAAIEDLAFCASCGNVLAKILGDYISQCADRALRLNMPSKIKRLSQVFSPVKKARSLNEAFDEIEASTLDIFPAMLDLYQASPEIFTSLRMIIPWMDEMCKTLEGIRLAKLSAKRLEAGESKRARDLLARSAAAGHGEAAFEIFQGLDKSSEEAVFYLDIASKCNMAEAFSWEAVLIEDGLKGRGNAVDANLKAVWKGSAEAYQNLKALKLGPFRKLRLAKADFAAKVLDLKEGD
jgi:TPR repeat protein